MTTEKFQSILSAIAKDEGITPQEVHLAMQEAINAAQHNPSPVIRARWKRIPRKGMLVTVEELLDYLTTHPDIRLQERQPAACPHFSHVNGALLIHLRKNL